MPSVVNNDHLLHNPNPNREGVAAPPPPRRICGILHKWVNCGKGWKPRWFVLQDGVLSYYKIHGSGKIIVAKETDKGCRVIGCGRFPHHRKPLGELHLKVSSIQESVTDERRFSIFTGTKRLHLKANSREDQIEWMQVLKAVKRMFPRVSNTELLNPISVNGVTVSTHKLRAPLLEEGVNEETIRDAERIMKTEFSEMLNEILIVRKKLRILIDKLGML